jgi:hypothetical protein
MFRAVLTKRLHRYAGASTRHRGLEPFSFAPSASGQMKINRLGAPSFDPIDRVTIKYDLYDREFLSARNYAQGTIQLAQKDKISTLRKRDGISKLLSAVSEVILGTERDQ